MTVKIIKLFLRHEIGAKTILIQQFSLLQDGDGFSIRDNKMVDQENVDVRQGRLQLIRQFNIVYGWFRISVWMIMKQDDCGGGMKKTVFKEICLF